MTKKYFHKIISFAVALCIALSASLCAWQFSTKAEEAKVIEGVTTATDIFTQSVGIQVNDEKTWFPNFKMIDSWGTAATDNRVYAVTLPLEENTAFKLNSYVDMEKITELETALGMESGEFDYKFYASKNLGVWTEITDVTRTVGEKFGDLTSVSHEMTVPEDTCYIKIEFPNDRSYRNELGDAGNYLMTISGYEYTECTDTVNIYNFETAADRDKVQTANVEKGNTGNEYTKEGFRATWSFCYSNASPSNRAYVTVPAVPGGSTVVINTVDKIDDSQIWGFEISTNNSTWQTVSNTSINSTESSYTLKSLNTLTYNEKSHSFTLPKGNESYSIKILFPQVTKVNGANMYFVLSSLVHYVDENASSDLVFQGSTDESEVFTLSSSIISSPVDGDNKWIVFDDAIKTWGSAATDNRAFGVSKAVEPGSKFTVKSIIKKEKIAQVEAALGMESGSLDYKFYSSADMTEWTEVTAINEKETGGSGNSVNVTHEFTVPDGAYFIKIMYPQDRNYTSITGDTGSDYFQMIGYSYVPTTANKNVLSFATEDGRNLVQQSNTEFGNSGWTNTLSGLRITWQFGYQSVSETTRGYVTVPAVTAGETFTAVTANMVGQDVEGWKFTYTADNETWTEVKQSDIKTYKSDYKQKSPQVDTYYTLNAYSFDLPEGNSTYLVRIYFPQTVKLSGNNMHCLLVAALYDGKTVSGDISLELEYPEEEIVDDFTNYPNVMDFSEITLQDAYDSLPSYTLDGVFTLNDASYTDGNTTKSLLTLTFASLYWNTINENTGKAYISYLVEPGTAFKVRALRHSYMDVLAQTLDSDFRFSLYGSKNGSEWECIDDMVTYKAVKNNLYDGAKHQAVETYEIAEVPEDIHFVRIYFPQERAYNDVLGGTECGQWNLALKYVAYTEGDINDVPIYEEDEDDDSLYEDDEDNDNLYEDDSDNSDSSDDYSDDDYSSDDSYTDDNSSYIPVINDNSTTDNKENEVIVDEDDDGEKVLKNERTGISVSYKDGVAFSSSVKMSVETIAQKNLPKTTVSILGSKRFVAYTVGITKNDIEAQPNNEVIIEIPVPEDFYAEGCIVCRVADDGRLTDMSAALEDGKMVFKTNRLGNFVVIENLTEPVNIWMIVSIALGGVLLLIIVYAVIVTVKAVKAKKR